VEAEPIKTQRNLAIAPPSVPLAMRRRSTSPVNHASQPSACGSGFMRGARRELDQR